ncbi:Echinoderm microtubule-associated protein-like 6 [Bienertia sinuspersici]
MKIFENSTKLEVRRTLKKIVKNLTIIFGADRATGVQSETFVQTIDNQEKETIELDKGDSDEDEDNGFSSYMNEMNMDMSTIASAFSTTQQHEQAIMAREEIEENKKNSLVNELLRIPGLTRFEVMQASKKLASNSSELSLFYQSPDDEWRKEFIVNLIHPMLDK